MPDAESRILTEDEVMNLPSMTKQWFEFKFSHRIDLDHLQLLKGHRSKGRMKEYGKK